MARSAMQRNSVLNLLSLSIGLAALLSAPCWATTTVDQIDVVSSRYGTELKLHADQPIQHRVIQASDTDMTIELSDVSPARHLRTNFSQAGQVHHVIVQPVGGNTLKVVLRGQSMGQPLVQVVYSQPPSSMATPHAMAQPLMPASQPMAATKPIATPVTSTPSGLPPVLSNPAKAPNLTSPLANPIATLTPAKAAAAPATVTDVSEPLYLEDNATGNALQTNGSASAPEVPAPTGLMGLLAQHWMYALIAGSMLLALVAGLGLFIYKKWQELQQPSRSGNVFRAMQQDDWQSAPSDDYRRGDEDEDSFFGNGHHAKKGNPWAQRPKVALQQPPKAAGRNTSMPHNNRQPQNSPQSPVDSLLASREKVSTRAIPPQQAVQQYARQQQPSAAASRLSNAANSVSSQRPSMASRPNTMATPVRNGGTANDPLPTNPNVVDFLKDVASYMEQDGERGKARRITRNLRHLD
ncbi:MAG: hypothetical protein QE263_03980 [Vampirovibrionales bacterium]|nr:hypothetical protein [Vampirovibrionales bacterium]